MAHNDLNRLRELVTRMALSSFSVGCDWGSWTN